MLIKRKRLKVTLKPPHPTKKVENGERENNKKNRNIDKDNKKRKRVVERNKGSLMPWWEKGKS